MRARTRAMEFTGEHIGEQMATVIPEEDVSVEALDDLFRRAFFVTRKATYT